MSEQPNTQADETKISLMEAGLQTRHLYEDPIVQAHLNELRSKFASLSTKIKSLQQSNKYSSAVSEETQKTLDLRTKLESLLEKIAKTQLTWGVELNKILQQSPLIADIYQTVDKNVQEVLQTTPDRLKEIFTMKIINQAALKEALAAPLSPDQLKAIKQLQTSTSKEIHDILTAKKGDATDVKSYLEYFKGRQSAITPIIDAIKRILDSLLAVIHNAIHGKNNPAKPYKHIMFSTGSTAGRLAEHLTKTIKKDDVPPAPRP